MTNQDIAIQKLEKKGFKVVHSHYEFPESDTIIYHLSKKGRTGSYHASVDGEGYVNGENVDDFLSILG